MKRRVYFSAILSFIVFSFLFLPFSLTADSRKEKISSRCGECSSPIDRRLFYRLENKGFYCSKKCAEKAQYKLLPKCSVCKNPAQRFWFINHSKEKRCDKCKDLPRCAFCKNYAKKKTPGNRFLCNTCSKTAIHDHQKAFALFRSLRKTLQYTLGIATDHSIVFSLDTPSSMEKKKGSKLDRGQTGLFIHRTQMQKEVKYDRRTGRTISRKVKVTDETYSISILYSLPFPEYRYTVIHELTHDWMSAHFRHITDLKTKEGVSEYISWLFLKNDPEATPYNAMICSNLEKNPDPVYGGGFRMIRKIAGTGDAQSCIARLKKYLSGRKK